jgi:two-component system, NtrC family, response regulator AtoC
VAIGRTDSFFTSFKDFPSGPIEVALIMRLLVLDDEAPFVALLVRFCRLEGHDVSAYTKQAQALAHLASHQVDVLITDLNMPGLDGMSVIREARKIQPDLFSMIITGHAGRYPLEEVLATGTADLMFKPFQRYELQTRLALAERRLRLIGALHERQRSLARASNEMIASLQAELEESRNPS